MDEALTLWEKIIKNGMRISTDFEEMLYLQNGASDIEIENFEKKLNLKMPQEMLNFYRVHNGQKWCVGCKSFVNNLTLISLDEIIETWEFINDEADWDGYTPDNSQEIKPMLWNPKWIPVATNGGGDYVCIDTDPTEQGILGQILYYYHDWEKRSVDAMGIFQFIERRLT